MKMYNMHRLFKTIRIIFMGKPFERRRIRQEAARISAQLFGDFYLGDDHKIWRKDLQFIDKFKELSPHNYYSMERKWTLREFARWTRELNGSVAESGTYVGVSAWFMASETPSDTMIYLFDSFEGLSTPSQKDSVASNDIPSWQKGDMLATEKEARNNLSSFDNISLIRGWIPDSFEEVKDIEFRLVHIDVDLYEPTLKSLEFFYPRMVESGVIVMDDYGYETCTGAYKAANEYADLVGEIIIHLPTGQGVIIKRNRLY